MTHTETTLYAIGNTVYAATQFGLGISTDGGTTFTNRRTNNSGLLSDALYAVYAIAGANGAPNTIYVATEGGGLSISTNGGTTFTNYTTANSGLGDDLVRGVYAVGGTVYAATHGGGLSIGSP